MLRMLDLTGCNKAFLARIICFFPFQTIVEWFNNVPHKDLFYHRRSQIEGPRILACTLHYLIACNPAGREMCMLPTATWSRRLPWC